MKLDEIKKILALMEEHNLVEVEFDENGRKIRLKKAASGDAELPVNLATPVPLVPSVPQGGPAPAGDSSGSAKDDSQKADDLIEVKSPMVGTLYRASAPDTEPFISTGDVVKEDTVICIIEAMKVMNEIKAEVEGEVVQILVENGEALEYGQPIMLIRPPSASSG